MKVRLTLLMGVDAQRHSEARICYGMAWPSDDGQWHGKSLKAMRSYGTAANAMQWRSEAKRRLAAATNCEATNRNRKRSGQKEDATWRK